MTETTMHLMILAIVLAILFVPLVYICVLRGSADAHRRLIELIRVLKRAPRKSRQLPTHRRWEELDNDEDDSAT